MSAEERALLPTDMDDDLSFDDDDSAGMVAADTSVVTVASAREGGAPEGKALPGNWRVLRFGRVAGLAADEQLLLWPVYGWLVVAPRVKPRTPDFLQVTVLRLARAGVTMYTHQAALLDLEKPLAYRIWRDMGRQGLISPDGKLTPKGTAMLAQEEAEDMETEVQPGIIFQEAVAGEVLPYFHTEELTFASRLHDDVQSARRLTPRRPFVKPETAVVLDAARRYDRLVGHARILEQESGEKASPAAYDTPALDGEEAEVTAPQAAERKPAPLNITGVRLLDDRPERFCLMVRVKLDGDPGGSFSLSCPFGLPDGHRWARLLHFAASQSEEDRTLVGELKAASAVLWHELEAVGLDPIAAQRLVSDRVAVELGKPPAPEWVRLWDLVSSMEQSRLFLEHGYPEHDSVLNRAQRALETLMLLLLHHERIPSDLWQRYQHGTALEDRLADTLAACGVPRPAIPRSLTAARIGVLRMILEGQHYSLRPYFQTLVLGASRPGSFHERFLRQLLERAPGFPADLQFVADARNRYGAHAGAEHRDPAGVALEAVGTTFRLIQQALAAFAQSTATGGPRLGEVR